MQSSRRIAVTIVFALLLSHEATPGLCEPGFAISAAADSVPTDSTGRDSIPQPPPPPPGDLPSIQQGDWLLLNDTAIQPGPSKRFHTPAVYDPDSNRMILFGGFDSHDALGGLYALTLHPTVEWQTLNLPNEPAPRWGHSAIYDSARKRILFFAGVLESGGATNDLWELSLGSQPMWTKLNPAGTPPAARVGQMAVLDAARDRIIVFGGNTGAHRNDVWELTLSPLRWTQLAPTGTPPGPRSAGAAIFDPVGDRMVIFGGADATAYLSDTWGLAFDGGPHWQLIAPSGSGPGKRVLASTIYDAARGGMWLYAGNAGFGYQDVWFLQLGASSTWGIVNPTGPAPGTARWSMATTFDPPANRMVVFGGVDGSPAVLDEIWALSLGPTPPTWARLHPGDGVVAPHPRWGHSAFLDAKGDRMVVFGGADVNPTPFNDLWALPLSQPDHWVPLTPTGTPPSPRFVHAAAYDTKRDQFFVTGGFDGGYAGDAWILQLSPPAWTRLNPFGAAPPGRDGHSAVYDPVADRMLIYGGWNGTTNFGDLWSLPRDGVAPTLAWSHLSPPGPAPEGKYSYGSAYDPTRNSWWIIGGLEGDVPTLQDGSMDVWRLSLTDPVQWVPVATFGTAPNARWGHSLVYDGYRDRLLLYGGVNYDRYFGDLWELSLTGTPAWRKIVPLGTPPPVRLATQAFMDPSRYWMIVNFGNQGLLVLGDTWAWRIDTPAPTLASWVNYEDRADGLHLLWSVSSGMPADIERRTESSDWTRLATASADESQQLLYVDGSTAPATRYGYRLVIDGSVYGEAWVRTASRTLQLVGLSSNPGTRNSTIGFTLAGTSSARLEMIDPRGRVVFARDVTGMGPGPHSVGLGGAVTRGVYWIRLTQGTEQRTAKAILF